MELSVKLDYLNNVKCKNQSLKWQGKMQNNFLKQKAI
jgi:hypothetical protein